jgi:Lar family restriction alleviation protein
MMSEELKKCPFCGGEAAMRHLENVSFYVVCTKCNAGIETYSDKDAAIAAWNRRAPEPGTSVIRWTRYDGTAETLPEECEPVLVRIRGRVHVQKREEDVWERMGQEIRCGDLWAYLPEPPEGME